MNPQNLVWLDLEMTGLNPRRDRILEIAVVVTDSNLEIVAEGPAIAIHQSEELLANMDEWNTTHHGQSGLVERVRGSEWTEAAAEQAVLTFLQNWVPANQSPMCGNSIWQDRRFLTEYMPTLADFFHYRNLDVSSLKILALRWYPQIAAGFKKESQHLALQDVHDSIAELRYYRDRLLIPREWAG